MVQKKNYLEQIPFVLERQHLLKFPFILDTSVSIINRGKLRVAAITGKKIPKNVALDKLRQTNH